MVSSSAGQLRSGTPLITANKMAATKRILISSQTISESSAAPAIVAGRRVVPHAIKALGPTTAKAPNSADSPWRADPKRVHSTTISTAAAPWNKTTRQGDVARCRARQAAASSGVRGSRALKSSSPASSQDSSFAPVGADGLVTSGCAMAAAAAWAASGVDAGAAACGSELTDPWGSIGKTQRLYVVSPYEQLTDAQQCIRTCP